jgi:hypothetical protein
VLVLAKVKQAGRRSGIVEGRTQVAAAVRNDAVQILVVRPHKQGAGHPIASCTVAGVRCGKDEQSTEAAGGCKENVRLIAPRQWGFHVRTTRGRRITRR